MNNALINLLSWCLAVGFIIVGAALLRQFQRLGNDFGRISAWFVLAFSSILLVFQIGIQIASAF